MKKIILFMIIALLLVSGCKKAEKEEVGQPPFPIEEPELEEAPVETISELEMISEARCIDNKIELVLTNPTDETFILGNTAKIIINGLIIVDPECDKLEIAPGESIYCADLSGHIAIRTGAKNTIQVNMKMERGLSVVDCAGQE